MPEQMSPRRAEGLDGRRMVVLGEVDQHLPPRIVGDGLKLFQITGVSWRPLCTRVAPLDAKPPTRSQE